MAATQPKLLLCAVCLAMCLEVPRALPLAPRKELLTSGHRSVIDDRNDDTEEEPDKAQVDKAVKAWMDQHTKDEQDKAIADLHAHWNDPIPAEVDLSKAMEAQAEGASSPAINWIVALPKVRVNLDKVRERIGTWLPSCQLKHACITTSQVMSRLVGRVETAIANTETGRGGERDLQSFREMPTFARLLLDDFAKGGTVSFDQLWASFEKNARGEAPHDLFAKWSEDVDFLTAIADVDGSGGLSYDELLGYIYTNIEVGQASCNCWSLADFRKMACFLGDHDGCPEGFSVDMADFLKNHELRVGEDEEKMLSRVTASLVERSGGSRQVF